MALRSAIARSRYRIRCTFDSVAPLTITSYAVARQDGGPGSTAVTLVFLPAPSDTATAAIILSDPLLEGIIYAVTVAGVTVLVSYQPPQTTERTRPGDDPEVQMFKLDLDWIDGDPDMAGDCPHRRGLPALDHDLLELAFLEPGELVHKPDAGGAVARLVNSTSTTAELDEAAGKIEAQYRRDPRVDTASVEVDATDDGNVKLNRFIKPIAVDDVFDLDG